MRFEAYSLDGDERFEFDDEGMEHAKNVENYWLSSLLFKGGLRSIDANGVVAVGDEGSIHELYDFYEDLKGMALPPETQIYAFQKGDIYSLLFKIPNLREPGIEEFNNLLSGFNKRLSAYEDKVPEDARKDFGYCFRIDAYKPNNWGVASDEKLYLFDIEAIIPPIEYFDKKYGEGNFITAHDLRGQATLR